jgi:hypothetical protein
VDPTWTQFKKLLGKIDWDVPEIVKETMMKGRMHCLNPACCEEKLKNAEFGTPLLMMHQYQLSSLEGVVDQWMQNGCRRKVLGFIEEIDQMVLPILGSIWLLQCQKAMGDLGENQSK